MAKDKGKPEYPPIKPVHTHRWSAWYSISSGVEQRECYCGTSQQRDKPGFNPN
jgi:hypothetical protein